MVSLLLELMGLALIVAAVGLFDLRLVPAAIGAYLMWTARTAA